MKAGIHPTYELSTVVCSCGNTFTTRSTKPELRSELCNDCHPFYTGKQKLVDTGGRIDRFERRYGRREARRPTSIPTRADGPRSGPPLMALDPEQRSRLLGTKIRVLVDGHWPVDLDAPGVVREPVGFGGGAAVVAGERAWVLLDGADHGLGSVLAWASRRGLADLDILADTDADPGVLARRAAFFAHPPTVWQVDDTTLRPAVPTPWRAPVPPADDVIAAAEALERAGLDVVVDHGVVSGEILGLEVARVVVGAEGDARVEVGVGRTDREAFAMVHGDLPLDDALQSVVDTVRGQRRAGASGHPLNRLAGERWLRAHLIGDPERLPGWHLEAVEGPIPRGSVNDVVPAIATGTDADGEPVVLACSVGIDLEVVPLAADAREARDPEARLVIAVPTRDAHEVTRALAAALRHPADVVPIEGDWRR